MQSGQTKSMVMALPDTGACVIVHNGHMRRYIELMMRDLRGVDFMRRCRVHVVYGHGCLSRLCGMRLPTFVDHAFYECTTASYATWRQMDAMIHQINLQFSPNA